jgi:hypothetical protein
LAAIDTKFFRNATGTTFRFLSVPYFEKKSGGADDIDDAIGDKILRHALFKYVLIS